MTQRWTGQQTLCLSLSWGFKPQGASGRKMNKHDPDLLKLLQEAKMDLRKVAEPEQSEIRDLMSRNPDWLATAMKASADAYTAR